jgi:hypothetical protein
LNQIRVFCSHESSRKFSLHISLEQDKSLQFQGVELEVLPTHITGTRQESSVPRSRAGSSPYTYHWNKTRVFCSQESSRKFSLDISLEEGKSLLFPVEKQEVISITYLWKDQSLLFPRVNQEVLTYKYLWNQTRVFCS